MPKMKAMYLLPALLLIGAAQATPPKTGQWEYQCVHAENTGWRMCGVSYRTILSDAESQTLVTLTIAAQRSGDARISVSARATEGGYQENSLCFYRENLLKVDGVGVDRLETKFNGFSYDLIHADPSLMIDGFLTGDSALLTLHNLPDCTSRDVLVSLEGFAAAWTKFKEESR